MVRNRFLAAALLSLPLAACGVEGSNEALTESADIGTLSTADVKAALSAIPGAEVLGKHADEVPYFVRGDFGSTGQSLRGFAARDAHARVGEALERIAPIFRLQAADLVVRRTTVDERGHTHIRYAQAKNGLEVVGHELIVHVDQDGRVYAANGSARDGESVAAQARLSPEAATQAALRATEGTGLSAEGARLVYYRAEGDNRLKLAYEVVVTGEGAGLPLRDHVFVSARDGLVLGRATDIHTALNRAVYSANNGSSLPGSLKRSEGGAATGDTHVDVNYDHLGTTYNCYKVNFNRDGYNNAGAQFKSTVHYSSSYVNAFWNGTQMVYGDGNNVDSGPLGKSLDVTVHELTHAVTENESGLVYSNESGALNEGMSDIFSAYCEAWTKNWVTDAAVYMIGDDIWTPATPGDALRYMGNPTQDGSSKDYYPERYTGASDNGGVHWNSGIANLAFKLLSEGGTHPRGKTTVVVPAIGIQKAGKIFYEANANCMTSSSNFAAAKACTEQKAEQFYGAVEKDATTKAWEAVGVGVPVPPPTTSPLTNGVAVTNLSDSSGGKKYYTLQVPAGQASLKFDTTGGTGDVDMYVKFGAAPDSATYDCRPYKGGNVENCTFTNPAAGTWYVMLNAYSSYSGVSLTGLYGSGGGTGGGTPTSQTINDSVASGAADNFGPYSVVAGTQFKVVMSGSGDPDLYVRFGAAPTTTTYNCRPYTSGAAETCDLTVPAGQSTAYIMVRGYSAATYTLNINYTKP